MPIMAIEGKIGYAPTDAVHAAVLPVGTEGEVIVRNRKRGENFRIIVVKNDLASDATRSLIAIGYKEKGGKKISIGGGTAVVPHRERPGVVVSHLQAKYRIR